MTARTNEVVFESGPPNAIGATGRPLPSVVTTLVAGAITLSLHVSFLISQLLRTAYHPVDVRIRIAIIVITGAASALLWTRRRSATDGLCALMFLCIVAPFWLTFWITEVNHILAGRYEQPFVGPKLMMFVISALCPTRPRWLAPALLTAMALEVTALWSFLSMGSIPSIVMTGEPWITASFLLLACFLFGSRLHWMRLHEELAVARAEATILHTTNEAFITVQDLANTPLQSLEIALALMTRQRAEDPLVRRAHRAVGRLRALTRHLPVDHLSDARVDGNALDEIRALRDSTVAERHPNGTPIQTHHEHDERSRAGVSWARLSHALGHHARHLLFRGAHASARRSRHL